ncbi:Tdrd5 [Columba guinea]|nr:Tdrd5 [Columba guinea]
MAGVDGSKRAQLMEVLKKELRSLLTAAKEGLTPAQLEQEYVAMIGKPLPLRDLGFRSTLELVANMPEVVRVCPYEKGTFILKAITDEATRGIARLVARQKSAKARKNAVVKADAASPSKNLQSFPWKGRAPVLPATVKAELRDLLSSSPLLLLEFNQAFSRRFGRAFQYTKYGFSSMSEVLRSVSDIIAVEQTRAGSLLTLKKHLARGREKKEVPRDKVWEELSQATPAVGMPPLEPIYETENLHLTAEEKTEPVETQVVDLGDRLKQPQDLEQSLQAKLIKTPEIPLDAVQDRKLCSLPQLETRCLVGVFVEFIVSPSQFYIHVCSRETSDKLQDMMIEMRWCYLKLPAQAIPCSLAWVKPMEGTWSSAATLLFKKLCNSKLLVGIVDEYVNGILHLFLCDTSTKEDVYFHCVLRDEGYADVCGENVPSQEFMELNPSALYIQASGTQNAEPVVPDPGLQQESLDTDSETATSKLDGDELCDQQWQLSAKQETWDDVQPLLHEVSVPRTDQDPELAQEELMAVVKAPHSLGESSMPAVLFKSVEDFHTSSIYSKQPAEMSQDDPDHIERFSNEIQLHEAVHPSVLLMAIPFMLDNRNSEEKVNKDLPGSLAAGPCGASELPGQGPSQKVYVPPARLSALVAAARLATSSDYFQWLPRLKKV